MPDAVIIDIPHSWVEPPKVIILFVQIIEKLPIICLDISDFYLAAPFDVFLESLSVTMS